MRRTALAALLGVLPLAVVVWPAVRPSSGPTPAEAITQAYVTAFDHRSSAEERFAAVAGDSGLEAAYAVVARTFPQAVATVEVSVHEVTVREDSATVRFELHYEGGAEFGEQVGFALRRDGRWLVSRTTVCMVYGWAGASC